MPRSSNGAGPAVSYVQTPAAALMASLCETRGACSGATRASIQAGTIFASSKPRAIVAKIKPTAPVFKWVNAALGTIKSALARTYRVVRQKHVARYLAEFGYHFNRKYKLEEMIPRLAFVALRTARIAYRLRKQAAATA